MFHKLKDRMAHFVDQQALHPSSTFRGGEGLSPWYIQCADPYDLGPPADLILCAIKGAQAEMAATGDKRPLVVLMSESHDMPAYIGLQKAVMNRMLQQKLDFAFRIELPHNTLKNIINKQKPPPPAELQAHCHRYDPEGRFTLSYIATNHRIDHAPAAFFDRTAFCLQRRIKTAFNDAAKTQGRFLDFDDPMTRKAAEDLHIKTNKLLKVLDADGIAVRNQLMASWPVKQDLILQMTGMSHTFGQVQETFGNKMGYPFAQSLVASYEKAGMRVLPVFITMERANVGLNIIPKEAYEYLPRSVLIDGLSQEGFYSEPFAAANYFPYEEGAEAKFITEELHDSTALLNAPFTDAATAKDDFEKLVLIEAKKFLDRFDNDNAAPSSRKQPQSTAGPR